MEEMCKKVLRSASAIMAELEKGNDVQQVQDQSVIGRIEEGIYNPTLIPELDADSVLKIPTGIGDLDQMLHGGIHTGGYTVIASTEGTGKTTFAGIQLVRGALEHGIKCMVMSDEDGVQRWHAQWLRATAGPRHIATPLDRSPYVYSDAKRYIDAYYRDSIFFLAPCDINNRTWSALRSKLEVYAAKGVKLFVLDNLTTLSSLIRQDAAYRTGDIYEAQARVCYDLRELGAKYGVAIVLIQHKRKMEGGRKRAAADNEDGSGSSAIKDLAMMYIHWNAYLVDADQRKTLNDGIMKEPGVSDSDERSALEALCSDLDRRLIIGKNRLYGFSATSSRALTLRYDPATLRYYRGYGDNDSPHLAHYITEQDEASMWEIGYYEHYLPEMYKKAYGKELDPAHYHIPQEVRFLKKQYEAQMAAAAKAQEQAEEKADEFTSLYPGVMACLKDTVDDVE